jgi:uncharacterized protein YjbI with pentapeptide repeats
LIGAALTGARLDRARLADASLIGADLGATTLCSVSFEGADLRYADSVPVFHIRIIMTSIEPLVR